MKKEYILVIDSGLGGMSVLLNLKNHFPTENFIYVLDNFYSPYGNKSKSELIKISINLVKKYINNFNLKLIIFACNTLTSVAIEKTREFIENQRIKTLKKLLTCKKILCDRKLLFSTIKFEKMLAKLNIVGTEPPIKQVSENEKTLILSTKQTLKHNKTLKLYRHNKNFTFLALENVAKLLDENFFNREKIVESLKKQIKVKNYKNVVLGCTHYYFLIEQIKKVLKNCNLKFFTAQDGILKRVKFLLDKNYDENIDKNMGIKFNKNVSKNIDKIASKNVDKNVAKFQKFGEIKLFLTKKDKKLSSVAKTLLEV